MGRTDRSGACDLVACAAGLGAAVGESCSFHYFPDLRPQCVVSWEEWDLWLICSKPPESDWHVF